MRGTCIGGRREEEAVETDSQAADFKSKGKNRRHDKSSKQGRAGRISSTPEPSQGSPSYYSEPPSSGFFTGWLLGSMLSGGSRSSYADSSSVAESHRHHSDPAPDPTPAVVDDTPSHSDSYDSGSSDSSGSDSYSSDSSFDSGGSSDSGGSFD